MPTLQGKWYFKDKLELPDTALSHSEPDPSGNGISPAFFKVADISYEYFSADSSDNPIVYGWGEAFPYGCSYDEANWGPIGSWKDNSFRKIEFLYEIEVTEEFYKWFTKNAVNLQPTGTWRFNTTAFIPPTSACHTNLTGACLHKGLNQYIAQISVSSSEFRIYADATQSYLCWTDQAGWAYGEDYAIITFHGNLNELDPEFALWFYENAHSMELKLYSECYIAEAVDTIRKHTGDTKGYTVKDLAVGIDKVAAKNANFGTWTFKDRLWDLGLGNYISEHGTTNKIDPNLIAPVVVFNVKFSTSAKIEASGTANSDMTETSEFVAMEFPHAINANSSISYYTSVDYSSGDCFRACVATPGNTDFYEGYEAAKTIILREEPSEELLDFLNTFATKEGGAVDTTATAADIRSGQTAVLDGVLTTGTMPEKTSSNLTVSGATVTVPAGYYATQASKSIATATQAVPNIAVDSNGMITASATQAAGYVSAGARSSTKQLTTQAAKTITPGTSDKPAVTAYTYTTGMVKVKGDANLIAANIKKDVSIFGVTGTLEEGVALGDVQISNMHVAPSLNGGSLCVTLTADNQTSDKVIGISSYSDPITSNVIKAGVNILGVTGTYGGEDLEALGSLCEWIVRMDDDSIPVVTIWNLHPTYFLKCSVEYTSVAGSDRRDLTIDPGEDLSVDYQVAIASGNDISVENIRWVKEL